MMSMPALFVAVVTGHNLSNVPPILQYARAGDNILWLESEMAASEQWLESTCRVLERREFKQYKGMALT